MQVAPVIAVRVDRFGRWRMMLALLSALMVATTTAFLTRWLSLRSAGMLALPDFNAGAVLQPAFAVTMAALASMLVVRASRVRPFVLRWNAQAWVLENREGSVSIALDLGWFMLLHFRFDDGGSRWLPVQQAGLEPVWHGLRCTVYSPRPTTRAAISSAVAP